MSLLDGFEMVVDKKVNYFITVRKTTITFSKTVIEALGFAPFVHCFIDKANARFAVQPCNDEAGAVAFYEKPEEGKQLLVRWAGKDRCDQLAALAGVVLDSNGIRVSGTYHPEENVVIFNLKDFKPAGKASLT